MKAALGWLGRTGLLYLLLCLATAFYILAWPTISRQLSDESLRQDVMSMNDVRAVLVAETAAAQAALDSRAGQMKSGSRTVLDAQLKAAKAHKAQLEESAIASEGWLDPVRPSRILAAKRLELQIAATNAEIGALTKALNARKAGDTFRRAQAAQKRYPQVYTREFIAKAQRECADARGKFDGFNKRNRVDRELRDIFLDQRKELANAVNKECGEAESYAEQRKRGIAAATALKAAQDRYNNVRQWSVDQLDDPGQKLSNRTLRDILRIAGWALLAALLLPLGIRTLFYYVLAPLVQAGPPIRLAKPDGEQPSANDGSGDEIGEGAGKSGGASGPSLPVTVPPGYELLIRQGFLQSSPAMIKGGLASAPAARTRWLLDGWRPFTSIASGLTFLTRASGSGGIYGLSTHDDPFAELARIDLAAGARLVLQPRALVAVMQPVSRPLQIRSNWRFGLHAWLTFQFRYLVFHGPVSLIVKGGRGVRIEPARDGRVFGQSQLIGYSADLAYTVQRNETFAPYLFGRAPLLRDKVAGGPDGLGILVLEESPRAGRSNGVRGGLEGMFDAGLKAFGI